MDIILITRQFPYGGNETFLETEIKYLSKHFDSVTIYPSTMCERVRVMPANVKVNNLIAEEYSKRIKWIFRTLLSFDMYFTLLRYMKQVKRGKSLWYLFKYCVSYNIYAFFCKKVEFDRHDDTLVYSYWFNPFVDVAAKKIRASLVTRVHGGDLYEDISELGFFPYRESTIREIRKIFPISEVGTKYLKAKYQTENISTSRLGVNNLPYIVSRASESIHELCIISVSNIIPVKRVDLIAKCLTKYAEQHPQVNVKWIHYGDGTEINAVNKIIAESDTPNFIYEFPGRVKNTFIYEYFKNHPIDIFINLSKSEGIPVSIMEAISYGVPIIATDVGGTNEIVNSSTGILLDPNPTEKQVTEAIDSLRKIPKDRKTIKNFWFENFNSDNNYERFCRELKELIQ